MEWISIHDRALSLLAAGTSLIGTPLGFSEFFKEQCKNSMLDDPSKWTSKLETELFGLKSPWERKRILLMSIMVVIAPYLLVSITIHDAFSAAKDIAGGYCMTMLYGILPPAMAWAMRRREIDKEALSNSRPTLVGVGLFACGIVAKQFLQDILLFHQ
ncbi:hypothetical protein SAY87_018366 [Trapa incisa]|uniref:Uncharacterized protein n=1 Tax=Trapa incisa TaxID=236973 RepID=A0AAN7L5A1_9MYRT|nr:hypothetical protein SAY87_018366 [Trapa incisa]